MLLRSQELPKDPEIPGAALLSALSQRPSYGSLILQASTPDDPTLEPREASKPSEHQKYPDFPTALNEGRFLKPYRDSNNGLL